MAVRDERAGFTSERRMSAARGPLEEPAINERCLSTRPAQTERNSKKRVSEDFGCSTLSLSAAQWGSSGGCLDFSSRHPDSLLAEKPRSFAGR
jgi:hypothetical protein